jgi:DNA-binding XRE family transcriptional regulator
MGRHRTIAGPIVDGRRIMAARRRAGISRRGAAEQLGVSESAVNRYEQGRTDPSAGILVMMAWMYHTTVEKLCRPRAEVLAERAAAITHEPGEQTG